MIAHSMQPTQTTLTNPPLSTCSFQCADLLYMEVKVASQGEQAVFGSQCSCIAAVLTDMTYNLGEAGISTFNTFIGYIKEHNWSAAAQDVRGTLWCRQVGNRCTRDSGIIANGC